MLAQCSNAFRVFFTVNGLKPTRKLHKEKAHRKKKPPGKFLRYSYNRGFLLEIIQIQLFRAIFRVCFLVRFGGLNNKCTWIYYFNHRPNHIWQLNVLSTMRTDTTSNLRGQKELDLNNCKIRVFRAIIVGHWENWTLSSNLNFDLAFSFYSSTYFGRN